MTGMTEMTGMTAVLASENFLKASTLLGTRTEAPKEKSRCFLEPSPVFEPFLKMLCQNRGSRNLGKGVSDGVRKGSGLP